MSLTAEQLGITWADCEKILYNATAQQLLDDYRIFTNRIWTLPLTIKQVETVIVQLTKHNNTEVNKIASEFIQKQKEHAKQLNDSLDSAQTLMEFNNNPDNVRDKLMYALSYENLPYEDSAENIINLLLKGLGTLGENWLTTFYFWLSDDSIHELRMSNYKKWGGVISNLRGENYYCKKFLNALTSLDNELFTNNWANMLLKHALQSYKTDIEYAVIEFVGAHSTGMYVVLLMEYQRAPFYSKRPFYIRQSCETVVGSFSKQKKM